VKAGRPAAASIAVPAQIEPLTPRQPAASSVDDPGHDDAVLRLAQAGDLHAVRARLGIQPPEWDESLVVTEQDKLGILNTHRLSMCLPPSEFDRVLRKLVQTSLQSGDGARSLDIALAHGQRDLALQMLKLMRSGSR
jgi:hypothetical protein